MRPCPAQRVGCPESSARLYALGELCSQLAFKHELGGSETNSHFCPENPYPSKTKRLGERP
jgi:hypothetical protein